MDSQMAEYNEPTDWKGFCGADSTREDQPRIVSYAVEEFLETSSAVETDDNFLEQKTPINNTVDDFNSMSVEFNKSNEMLGLHPDSTNIQEPAPAAYSSIVCNANTDTDTRFEFKTFTSTNESFDVNTTNSFIGQTMIGHKPRKIPTPEDVLKAVVRNRNNASRHRILKKNKLEELENTVVDKDNKIKELTILLEEEKKTVAVMRDMVRSLST